MAHTHIVCHSSPEAVFAVLADPRPYGYMVVGTRTIRRFDPTWPDPGARFHHSLGIGVTLVRDVTEALEAVPGRRLSLRANMRPWSANDVVFALTPQDGATLVEMTETPVDGPAAAPGVRAVVDRLLWLRNLLVLNRLRTIAERRARRVAWLEGRERDATGRDTGG